MSALISITFRGRRALRLNLTSTIPWLRILEKVIFPVQTLASSVAGGTVTAAREGLEQGSDMIVDNDGECLHTLARCQCPGAGREFLHFPQALGDMLLLLQAPHFGEVTGKGQWDHEGKWVEQRNLRGDL